MTIYKKILAIFTLISIIVGCGILAACAPEFGEWIVTKAATCTEDGERIRYAKDDETVYEKEVIPALGHRFVEGDEDGWVLIEEPTYESEGLERRDCIRCDYFETRPVDKLDEPLHLKLMDGNTLLKKVYANEDGSYDLTEEEVVKIGYTFVRFVDAEGNDFQLQGTITESTRVSTEWQIVETVTLAQLKEFAGAGVDKIHIAADFDITESVYVVGKTEIYVTNSHTLTRGVDFAGDLFVIGETEDGENTQIVFGVTANLTLTALGNATLTVDGNKDNVTVDVGGTAFLVLYGAQFNMRDGVVVQNCKKVQNIKLLTQDENGGNKYALSYINRIGGAAVIVVNGIFNMYGGEIANNEVNTDEPDSDTEDDEDDGIAKISTCGGAIYSNSNVNIYGGVLKNNKAARGGAIYNYRKLSIYKGELNENQASVYGGAVYLPGSQYAELFVGEEHATQNLVTFEANSAIKSGGVIFGQMKNSITIYGGATFVKNTAESNGGAINTSGALTVYDATFSENKAASKGGAIYVYYADIELTTRQVNIFKGAFVSNEASKGGAIAFSASNAEFEKGSIGLIGEVTFQGNKAFATATADPDLSDSEDDTSGTFNGNGGAIYVARNSEVVVDGATFSQNNAAVKGGAIYITGASNVEIYNSKFESNKAEGNGGAVYGYTGITLSVEDSDFTSNISTTRGGALYLSGAIVTIVGGTFDGNTANTETGGAIGAYSSTQLSITGTSFANNEAKTNGGALYFSGAQATITKVAFDANHAQGIAGAIYFTSSTSATVTDGTFTNNTAKSHAGALGVYSKANVVMDGVTTFTNNSATGNGGAIYITSGAETVIRIKEVNATANSAASGGFLFITTTSTTAYIYGGTIKNNTASTGGNTFYGNAAKAYLYLEKSAIDTDYGYTGYNKLTQYETIEEEWGSWETQE